jgi:hypothetical protein
VVVFTLHPAAANKRKKLAARAVRIDRLRIVFFTLIHSASRQFVARLQAKL